MNFFLHLSIGLRPYSTKPVNNSSDLKPEVIYHNCELDKAKILRDNKDKKAVKYFKEDSNLINDLEGREQADRWTRCFVLWYFIEIGSKGG